MTWFSENWQLALGIIEILLIALSIAVAAGVFVRRNRALKDLIYVEQERDDLKSKLPLAEVRLDRIAPERFIDTVTDLRTQGDWPAAEERCDT